MWYPCADGTARREPGPGCLRISKALLAECFHAVCGYSLHAVQHEVDQGFVTLAGGHRVGVCWRMAQLEGARWCVRDITSMNVRIARTVMCAVPPGLERPGPDGLLIAGAPGSGKTTLLRLAGGALGGVGRVRSGGGRAPRALPRTSRGARCTATSFPAIRSTSA